MLERVITFIVLGFFVFVADAGSWWQSGSIFEWYANYLLWVGIIICCYIKTRQRRSSRQS